MVDVVRQLCIKSYEITAENGTHFIVQQGEVYTTTVPTDNDKVTVFSSFWVPVPKNHFVEAEKHE